MRGAAKALAAWLRMPFTRPGRQELAWLVGSGIDDTVRRSGCLPQVAWAQDGEDLLFDDLFPDSGLYVDVGAHHPDRYSVTRKLHDRGWRGVNIDWGSGFESAFASVRPGDVTVRALVGTPRSAKLWLFREPALNTLSEHRARQLADLGWDIVSVDEVAVRGLADILSEVLPDQTIDLLSVDVEGEDLAVLQSHDWSRWPVSRCLVEIVEPAFSVLDHPVAQFLTARGMRLTRVWARSCLFESDYQADPLDRSQH
jgi:hypothetical protein